MKKIIVFFTFAFILVFGFAFISHTEVKATGENDGKTVTTVGAAIRTAEPAGLRFAGEVSEAFVGTSVEYGFVITKGTVTKDTLLTRLAGSTANKVDAGDLDGQNRFYVSVINIPAKGYDTELTVLAYVEVDGAITYADSIVTRSILDVATVEVEDNSNDNAFINRIYNTSTFVLNGGEFTPTASAVVGAYKAGGDGGSGLTLSPKGNNYSNNWWYRVCLEKTGYDSHLYKVVATYAGGSSAIANKDIPVDYDYILAGYSGSYVTQATNIGNCEYVFISALATGAQIKASDDVELLLCGNANAAYPINDSTSLPNARRDHYTFNGWYGNVGLTGDTITTKLGNGAETFYAKWTPVNHTLSYDLQGGKVDGNSSLDNTIFTIESGAIALPIASRMSKTDYTFVEWNTRADGTGTSITELPAGSHANTTVYAIWASDIPIEVSLSSADSTLITEISPNKFVKSDFTAGRFTINGNPYTAGTQLFSSISAAIASAAANDVIYVFPGTYADNLTIGTSNLTIVGSNGLLELTHSSVFDESAANNAKITGTITVSSSTSNIILRGFLLKAKVTLSGVSTFALKNCVLSASSSVDGPVTVDAASNALVFDHIYQLGSGARCFYIKANVNGFDMQNCAVLDAATVNLAGSNNLDFVRFGSGTESQVYGTVVFKNNYVRACQSGLQVRNAKCNAKTTTFTIEGNYFYKVPAAVYLGAGSYAPASSTSVSYNISKNTFIDCGSKANDWDVIVVCAATNTNIQIHNNALIDSFKTNTGSKTDYVIKVRANEGTISCSNNYFEGTTGPISNVLNATGVSQLDTSTSTTTANAYEPYQVVEINSSIYIYGVNLSQEN